MGIRARIGAGEWDLLVCEACGHIWQDPDIDPAWTDEPELGHAECPSCHETRRIVREERG